MVAAVTSITKSKAQSQGACRYHWLIHGKFESAEWVVVDDLPTSPKPEKRIRWNIQVYDPKRPDEICLLTDPQYSHLLLTIKRKSIGMRVGRHANVTTADTHEEMTRQIVNWVLWMIG